MINLLDTEAKKNLRRTYLMRAGAAGLFLLAGVLFVGTVTLLPAYVLALSKKNDAMIAAQDISAALAQAKKDSPTAQITALKERIRALSQGGEEGGFTEVLAGAIEARPSGITLVDISYTGAGTSSKVALIGSASTRDSLLAYQKTLQKNTRFKSVDLPISNLAKDRNIDFTITLTGAF